MYIAQCFEQSSQIYNEPCINPICIRALIKVVLFDPLLYRVLIALKIWVGVRTVAA